MFALCFQMFIADLDTCKNRLHSGDIRHTDSGTIGVNGLNQIAKNMSEQELRMSCLVSFELEQKSLGHLKPWSMDGQTLGKSLIQLQTTKE